MYSTVLTSSRDSLLVGIPFLLVLLIGYFRLDEIFASRHSSGRRRGPTAGLDVDGEPLLCDPDGKPWT